MKITVIANLFLILTNEFFIGHCQYTNSGSTPSQDSCVYISQSASYGNTNLAITTLAPLLATPRRPRPTNRPQKAAANDSGYVDDDDIPVSRNIIGGTALPQKAWPFLVALLVTGDTLRYNGQYWDLVCGGTLIHPQFILTAAHCFVDEENTNWRFLDASNFVARIGEYDLVKQNVPTAVTVRIVSYRTYPGFNYDTVEAGYDIAIAKLERPVAYNDWTQPACLPQSGSPVPRYNAPCLVAGWGSINKEGSRLSAYPRITTLPTSTSTACYSTLEIPNSARDGRLFCAGDPTGTRDSCAGDSGGPTFCQRDNGSWELSGVVSFGGENCADSEVPGAYTTVSYYVNWIQTTMQSLGGGSSYSASPTSFQTRQPSQPSPQWPSYRPPVSTTRRPWQPFLPGRPSNSPNYYRLQTTTTRTDAALLQLLEILISSMGGHHSSNLNNNYNGNTRQQFNHTNPSWEDLP